MLNGEYKIIKSAISGEASAFGLLYDRYQPQIYRFIYLKTGQREEAEDLTHQVFLNAWKCIEDYEHKGFPFSSWLYQIARNQIIDFYRVKKPNVSLEFVEEVEFDGDPPEILASHSFNLEIIQKAIIELKPEHQDIIIMRFVEDMTPKEMSLALNKPESTIRVLQHRAIKNLKNIVSKKTSVKTDKK